MADKTTINVTSHNQLGGITAGVVNLNSASPRMLSSSDKKILQSIPAHAQINIEHSLNDAEAYQYAEQILEYLKLENKNVSEQISMCMWIPPVQGQEIIQGEESCIIRIGTQ